MPTREEKIRKILIKFTKELKKGNMGVSDLIRMIMDWHESELAKQRGEIVNQINEIDIKEMNVINTQVLHRPKDLYLLGRNAGHQNLVKKIVSNIHQKGGEDE